jgi:dTDP-4-dehydrorhamnose reductase
MTAPHLFCFGLGYSALALGRHLAAESWIVSGTSRTDQKAIAMSKEGFSAHIFEREHPLPMVALAPVTHILVSIPPDADGDPVLAAHAEDIAAIEGLCWLAYLSTTGVYGDRDGGWVDEAAEIRPTSERGRRRFAAETDWLDLWRRHGVPVHVFRLAGIYGPERSAFDTLRAGTAKRLDKPGQVFSRIHIEDLATALRASMARPRPGAIYNVCDDDPAPPGNVIAHAAMLLGVPLPPLVPLETAGLSPVARSFYADNKRVSNQLIKEELGVRLRYPNYRAGLAAILAQEACPKSRHPASFAQKTDPV